MSTDASPPMRASSSMPACDAEFQAVWSLVHLALTYTLLNAWPIATVLLQLVPERTLAA